MAVESRTDRGARSLGDAAAGPKTGVTAALTVGVAAGWRDRAGRFSPLRLAALCLVLAPGLWLAVLLASGAAGAKPIETALDITGVWAVRFLLISLCVSPFRRIFGWSKLIQVRRMLGIAAASYAGAHFSTYVIDQNFDLLRIGSEIALRVYLTIGFLTLLGLGVLAITSTDRWIRRLGPRWRALHRLAYPIAALALVHYLMQSKLDAASATLLVGLFFLLMAYRLMDRAGRLQPVWLFVAALLAVPATMVFELGWYAAATSVPVDRVWAANFTYFSHFVGPLRPAWDVGLAGGAVALLAALMRWRRGRSAG